MNPSRSASKPLLQPGVEHRSEKGIVRIDMSDNAWVRFACVMMMLSVCTVIPVALEAMVAAKRPLGIDDLFALRRVGSPQISPEGDWVAYTVTTTDLEDDRIETRVWMAPISGGDPIPMTVAGTSADNPRWSPDGKYLAFTAARNGDKSQVWVLDRRGGEGRQLTDLKQGVGGYEWSPGGDRLVLTARDPEPDDAEGQKAWSSEAKKPYVIDRLQFKRDVAGYLTGDRHTHLYVFDLATEKLTQITSGRYDESQPAWSPGGDLIAFVSNRTDEPDANSNTDIWLVGADNTDAGGTLLQVTINPGSDGSPAWSPDGNWITYTTSVEPELIWYATTHLGLVAVEGGEPRLPTRSLDRNVRSARFGPDGKNVWFVVGDSGERHLARLNVETGRIDRPIGGARSVRAWDQRSDGTVVALISEPGLPGELFVLDPEGELRRLTHTNDELMAEIELGEVENVHFPSADGTEIEGFVVKPPGFDPTFRYPMLLRIHGGPVAQYEMSFNFEAQLFAANGYVVLMTNPRGSSGYGQQFAARLWADWGNVDFEDVMAGVDHVIDKGYADPARLGVGGWSYGGILTDHVITRTDRFKAAITGASEVLYVANYGHDHYQLQWEKELGLPWVPGNREKWEAISPFNRVDKIRTPTLIMGGELDWNVPIQNSEQLYQALRRLGVPTQLVVYPGQHHSLRVPAYQKDRYERYLDWYGRWVKGEPRN